METAGQLQGAGSVAMQAKGVGDDRDLDAFDRTHFAFANHAEGLGNGGFVVAQQRLGVRARREEAVGPIAPIRKNFGRHFQSEGAACGEQMTAREADENQIGINRSDGRGDGVGVLPTAGCQIVQGAVKFDVTDSDARFPCDILGDPNLVEDKRGGGLWSHRKLQPAEMGPIHKSGMRPDRHAEPLRQVHRPA